VSVTINVSIPPQKKRAKVRAALVRDLLAATAHHGNLLSQIAGLIAADVGPTHVSGINLSGGATCNIGDAD